MKYALSALAGALLVTSAVIWAGHSEAAIFIAGGFTASLVWLMSAEAIGFARVGRFLAMLDRASAGFAAPAAPRSASATNGQVPHCGSEKPAPSSRATTPGRRKNHTTHPTTVVSFQKPKNTNVLKPLQQEVVSALVNLGMPMNQAIQNVTAATQDHPGLDFDSLFRMCLPNQKRATA